MPERDEPTRLRKQEKQDPVEHGERMLEQHLRAVAALRAGRAPRQCSCSASSTPSPESAADVYAVSGRKAIARSSSGGSERLGAGKTPERGLGHVASRRGHRDRTRDSPGTSTAGVDKPHCHSVAAECPPCIRGDTSPDRFAPCRGKPLVVADDHGGRMSCFDPTGRSQAEHASVRLVGPSRDHEAERAKKGNESVSAMARTPDEGPSAEADELAARSMPLAAIAGTGA